jgi:Cu/Ag efflux pump CusA
MRPILLTAAAASLGMVPIAAQVFWRPMANAMTGGILAATVLTLLFLPALSLPGSGSRLRLGRRGMTTSRRARLRALE